MRPFPAPDDPYQRHQARRANLLLGVMTMTSLLLVGAMMFALCGGVMVQAFAVIAGVGLIGIIHYWTWGRSMSRETEAVQEAELRALGELDDWNVDNPPKHPPRADEGS